MTSLVLFKSEKENLPENFDWGTGKRQQRRASINANFDHASGMYLYTGEPTSQTYQNTALTLSNVRTNDELIPPPQRVSDLSSQQIPLKFPSNHPFSSHISEKSMFPTSDYDHHDRPSTDQEPYIVTHKIRGNPYRREVHFQGFVQKKQTKWPDKHYMQLPRSLSNVDTTSIYPWPRKIFQPNDNPSSTMVKQKQETTYQAAFTNEEESDKHASYDSTTDDESNHRIQRDEPIKVMSLDEHLDDQLRNGTDYVNLPANHYPTDRAPTWTISPSKPNQSKDDIRFLQTTKQDEISQLEHDRCLIHQQIEVDNRLQQIEVIRPQDNIQLLHLKYENLQKSNHNRPILSQYTDQYIQTFYDQTEKYIQERSGLYHTDNYDPMALIQSIPELESTTNNQQDQDNDLKDETNLSQLLNLAEQKQNKSKPNLFQYKAIGDYQAMRNRLVQSFRVPTDTSTVDVRIQEGDKNPLIQRESIYGQSFNTRKFLQENSLLTNARLDPTRLISTKYNRNLERVRNMNSSPMKSIQNQLNNQEQHVSEDIILGPFLPPSPYNDLYSTNYITEHTNGYSRRSTARVYESPFKTQQDTLAYKHYPKQSSTSIPFYPQKTNQLPTSAKLRLALPGPEIVTRSVDMKSPAHSIYQRSYKDTSFYSIRQSMPNSKYISDEQKDSHSKQLTLMDLQDRWSKTRAQRDYHFEHPESVPYVGDGTFRAKREILIADIIERERMMTVR